jgi:hypothetical protein
MNIKEKEIPKENIIIKEFLKNKLKIDEGKIEYYTRELGPVFDDYLLSKIEDV